jgi:Myo-inositol oxygenase
MHSHELGNIVSLIEPSLICRKSIPEAVEVKSSCLSDSTDNLARLAHPTYSQKGSTIDASCIYYLYHILKHNDVLIPDEGLSILRYYASLKSHLFHKGGALVRQNSNNLQELVNDFDLIRQIASQNCQDELSDEQCNNLWESHYNHLIKKYGMSKALQWEIEFRTNESSVIQDYFGHSTLNFQL